MVSTKLYDAVVKTGSYTDRDENEKSRYENVGSVFRNDNGQYLVLKKTFNPAGVPGDGDSIFVSFFEPKPKGGDRHEERQGGYANQQKEPPARNLDDEIPF